MSILQEPISFEETDGQLNYFATVFQLQMLQSFECLKIMMNSDVLKIGRSRQHSYRAS
jgi:hypothetical protein